MGDQVLPPKKLVGIVGVDQRKRLKQRKPYKTRGFEDCSGNQKRTEKGWLSRSKMGRVVAFENGVLMLLNISTPILNATDVSRKRAFYGTMSVIIIVSCPGEKCKIWVLKYVQLGAPNGNVF